jgi:hypothetical protein
MKKEEKEINYVIEDMCDNIHCNNHGKKSKYTTEDKPHQMIEAEGYKFAPALNQEVFMKSMFPIKSVCPGCMTVKKVLSKTPYEVIVDRFKSISAKKAKGDRGKHYYKDFSLRQSDLKTDPNAGKGYDKLSDSEAKTIEERFKRISNN